MSAATKDRLVAVEVGMGECDVIAVAVDSADVQLAEAFTERVEQCAFAETTAIAA